MDCPPRPPGDSDPREHVSEDEPVVGPQRVIGDVHESTARVPGKPRIRPLRDDPASLVVVERNRQAEQAARGRRALDFGGLPTSPTCQPAYVLTASSDRATTPGTRLNFEDGMNSSTYPLAGRRPRPG